MNYGAGPSRPPPIPYDDPYSDSFTSIPTDGGGEGSATFNVRNDTGNHDPMRPGPTSLVGSPGGSDSRARTNDRNLDPGLRHHAPRGRGRGGGRNRQSDRGRRGRGRGKPQHTQQRYQPLPQRGGPHDYSSGLTPPGSFAHPHNHQPSYGGGVEEWSYTTSLMTPQPPVFGFGLSNFSGVQPHINPRFANQLGFNFSQTPQIPQMPPNVESQSPSEPYHPGDANSQPTTNNPQWEESG